MKQKAECKNSFKRSARQLVKIFEQLIIED
jgi:hypothetical protein